MNWWRFTDAVYLDRKGRVRQFKIGAHDTFLACFNFPTYEIRKLERPSLRRSPRFCGVEGWQRESIYSQRRPRFRRRRPR